MGHLLLLYVLATFVATTSAFSILVVAPLVSVSHHILIVPVVKELLNRGHRVHYAGIQSIDVEDDVKHNYTEIIFENLTRTLYTDNKMTQPAEWSTYTVVYTTYFIYEISNVMCKAGLKTQGSKKLFQVIKNTEFDVIVQDVALCQCYYSLWDMAKGNPGIVGYIPYGLSAYAKDITGGFNYPQLKPYAFAPAAPPFNIWQKTLNTFYFLTGSVIRNYYYFPRVQSVTEEHFHEKITPLWELEKKIDLLLINGHSSFEPGIPLPPNAVEVGGLHAQTSKPVKNEKIKRFLDEATNGAVVVSLGTNVGWNAINDDKLKTTMTALSKLKQRVLWKLDIDVPFQLPSNIMALKWIPQGDVMTHKNIKAAWIHVGLLSTQEAIWNGIPLIAMPIFMDQWPTMKLLCSKGVAVYLDFNTLSVETIIDAFDKVLYDPSYSRNMKTLSIQFRDRPLPPLDSAVWHIEYVARNPGRIVSWAGKHMNWIESNLYDVYALSLVIILCIIYICYLMLKALFSKSLKLTKIDKQKRN